MAIVGERRFTDVSVERELVSSYTVVSVVRCNWNEGRGEERTVESALMGSPSGEWWSIMWIRTKGSQG